MVEALCPRPRAATKVLILETACPLAMGHGLLSSAPVMMASSVPILFAALGVAIASGVTMPLQQGERRGWGWLVGLLACAVCFQVPWAGWLPDMIGRDSTPPLNLDHRLPVDRNSQ